MSRGPGESAEGAVGKVLEVLEGVVEKHNGFWALCPAHDDHDPSLHIQEGDDGRALVKCRANCDQENVLAALEQLGIKRRDLFAGDGGGERGRVVPLRERAKAARNAAKSRERLVKAYHVKDASGRLCGIHERWGDSSRPDHKSFRWRLPNGKYSKGDIDPAAMPLFNSERVSEWPEEYGIVVGEGETPAEALMGRNIRAVGTVCGASLTPSAEVLEVLRGRRVILWPDNDEAGRAHMRRVAKALEGVAASVRWFEPEGAQHKDDGADHPAIVSGDKEALKELGRQLRAAPALEPSEYEEASEEPEVAPGRTLLGRVMVEGVEPPEELVEDILLASRVHSIYSAASTGKTFLALWLILRVIERGLKVLIFDRENGYRIMAERLEQLGADPARVDELVHYYFYPDLPVSEEGLFDYETLLDSVGPALVVFDSWINFLAPEGMDENSSNDVSTWAAHYTHPARSRGIAVLLLDHVPKEGNSSRGSSRKRDEVDVMWALRNSIPFDRDTVGRIVLSREKDREGWLPESVGFSVGGGAGGFVFARSAGTLEQEDEDGLKGSERKALEALEDFGKRGAKAAEWQKAAEKLKVARRTFYRAKGELLRKGRIYLENGRFYPRGATGAKEVPRHRMAPGPKEVPSVPPPYRVAPNGTGAAPDEGEDDFSDLRDLLENEEGSA